MSLDDKDWAPFSELVRAEESAQGLSPGTFKTGETAFNTAICRYLKGFLETNKTINLSGIRDFRGCVWKHAFDSLALVKVAGLGACLDWGTGGGFPGVPLALWRQHILGVAEDVVLLDSRVRKIEALEKLVEKCGVELCQCRAGRGEDLIREESFDSVVMRAVAPPKMAIKWISRDVGLWVFMDGPSGEERWMEMKPKLKKKGFNISDVIVSELPHELGKRTLICIKRV